MDEMGKTGEENGRKDGGDDNLNWAIYEASL